MKWNVSQVRDIWWKTVFKLSKLLSAVDQKKVSECVQKYNKGCMSVCLGQFWQSKAEDDRIWHVQPQAVALSWSRTAYTTASPVSVVTRTATGSGPQWSRTAYTTASPVSVVTRTATGSGPQWSPTACITASMVSVVTRTATENGPQLYNTACTTASPVSVLARTATGSGPQWSPTACTTASPVSIVTRTATGRGPQWSPYCLHHSLADKVKLHVQPQAMALSGPLPPAP